MAETIKMDKEFCDSHREVISWLSDELNFLRRKFIAAHQAEVCDEVLAHIWQIELCISGIAIIHHCFGEDVASRQVEILQEAVDSGEFDLVKWSRLS